MVVVSTLPTATNTNDQLSRYPAMPQGRITFVAKQIRAPFGSVDVKVDPAGPGTTSPRERNVQAGERHGHNLAR